MEIKARNKAISFYKLIIFRINFYLKNKIWEFFFIYSNFFPIIFFNTLYLYSKKEAIEFLLIFNLISILTLSLSANTRNISILHAGPIYLKKVMKFRSFSSLVILIIIYFLQSFLSIGESIFSLSINLLALSFWIIEPIVILSEIKKKNFKVSILLFLSHLFVCLNFLFIYYIYRQKDVLILFFFILIFINTFYLLYFFCSKKTLNIEYSYRKSQFSSQILNKLAFLSSIFIISSVFLIRYFLSNKLDYNLAADVIFCLSIVSFPGSLITGFYGAKYLNKDIILPSIFKYIFIFFSLSFFVSIAILSMNLYPLYNSFLKLLCLSLIGSLFMFFAQAFRTLHMSSMNMQSVFYKDIYFHLFLFFLAYLLISYFNVYLLFLIYPFMAFVTYCSTIKLYDFVKKK